MSELNDLDVIDCELVDNPPLVPGIAGRYVTVRATLEDGRKLDVFSYYNDELTFGPGDFIGRTVGQARELHHERDVAYLRSP